MDRFREMEVFTAVADAGSLAKAGRDLRLSPPAVTRAIAGLEQRLGTRLFNRTTRSLSLTDAGRRFLETARRLLSDLEAAEKAATGETAAAQGHLAITASVSLGRMVVAPMVADFLARQPRITASLLLVDRVVNLVEEGIDCAIRIGELPDSSLVARRVGVVRRVLVASPAYLAERGVPATPADLKSHEVIGFTGLMAPREWRCVAGKSQRSVAVTPRLEVNDAGAAIAVAEAGRGITLALSYMVADQIRAGALVPVLLGVTPPAVPVQIVYPESRLVAPKLRALVDDLAPALGARLHDVGDV